MIPLPDVPPSLHDALSRAWEYARANSLPRVDLALVRKIYGLTVIKERSRAKRLVPFVDQVKTDPGHDRPEPLSAVLDRLSVEARAEFERLARSHERGRLPVRKGRAVLEKAGHFSLYTDRADAS